MGGKPMRKKRDVNGIILSIILFGNLIGINWIAKRNQIERIFPLKHPFQKWRVFIDVFSYFILFRWQGWWGENFNTTNMVGFPRKMRLYYCIGENQWFDWREDVVTRERQRRGWEMMDRSGDNSRKVNRIAYCLFMKMLFK